MNQSVTAPSPTPSLFEAMQAIQKAGNKLVTPSPPPPPPQQVIVPTAVTSSSVFGNDSDFYKRVWWYYLDPNSVMQGPFTTEQMGNWNALGYFTKDLPLSYNQSKQAPANISIFKPLGQLFPNNRIPFKENPIQMNYHEKEKDKSVVIPQPSQPAVVQRSVSPQMKPTSPKEKLTESLKGLLGLAPASPVTAPSRTPPPSQPPQQPPAPTQVPKSHSPEPDHHKSWLWSPADEARVARDVEGSSKLTLAEIMRKEEAEQSNTNPKSNQKISPTQNFSGRPVQQPIQQPPQTSSARPSSSPTSKPSNNTANVGGKKKVSGSTPKKQNK